jgi:serine protease Do
MRQPSPVGFREFAKRFAQARHPAAPRTRRSVPRHPVTILDGCSIETQQLVAKMLGEAIEVGAPIYNEGKAAACYHVYDGAASDLLRKLPRTCKGPARALADAQKRAMSLPDSSAKAWTMRDAFDGLLEVIVRKHQR